MIELETGWAHALALDEAARADANLVSARRAGAKVVEEAEARVALARRRLAEIEAEMMEVSNSHD